MSTKEKILSILNSDSLKNDFISGEELASCCQVSRAAVHKAISALREQGFLIEAVTNKGYKLESVPDRIDSDFIEKEILKCGEKCEVLAFDEIDSTNLEAKRQTADKELNRVLFVAGRQTAGRGRMGRTFVSPANSGIYFSLVYKPVAGIKNPAFLTAAAAVAVSRAIKSLYGEDCKIKWVNDVFLNGKKICGILTEGVTNFETGTIDVAIVGIGINVRNCGFDEELSKVAGSVEEIIAREGKTVPKVSRNQIVSEVISNLLKIYDFYFADDKQEIKKTMDEYRKRSLLTGLKVCVNPIAGLEGKIYKAKVLDVTDEAELLVLTEDGIQKKLFSGEVSLKSSNFANQN